MRDTYYQSEFKSFERFIDFASELMVTRADFNSFLASDFELVTLTIKTVDHKTVIYAFYGLGERSFSKIKALYSPKEISQLVEYYKTIKEPSTEDQWAAQKAILHQFDKIKAANRAESGI